MAVSDTSFEKDFDKIYKDLGQKLTTLENDIANILNTWVANPGKSATSVDAALTALDAKYDEMLALFDEWTGDNLPRAYVSYMSKLNARIKAIKAFAVVGKMTLEELLASDASRQIVAALYNDAIAEFRAAIEAGKAQANAIIRRTQQTLLSEALINLTVAEGFAGGNLQTAVSALTGQLVERLGGGNVVNVNGRNYKASYYAELVARTKFHAAHTSSTVLTAGNYGTDLVVVSDHNTATELCNHYEGRTFSLTGKNKDFALLDMLPPFHPNCLHLIYPTFAQALILDGTYDKASRASKAA